MQKIGKQISERRASSRDDTSAGCWDSCAAATASSAGVDVATAVEFTLLTQEVRTVDSNLQGPLGRGLSALLLG